MYTAGKELLQVSKLKNGSCPLGRSTNKQLSLENVSQLGFSPCQARLKIRRRSGRLLRLPPQAMILVLTWYAKRNALGAK